METQQGNGQKRGLKPFTAGDPRINRKGRPKGFDEFRKMAQQIAGEKVTLADGNHMMVIEAILRSWAKSTEPALQKAFVEYCYGKPPEKLEVNQLEHKTVLRLHYAHEFPSEPSFRPEAFAKLPEDEQKRLTEKCGDSGVVPRSLPDGAGSQPIS